ncbi:MAG: ADP-ribosylation factor-like protein [Candidatus Hodarchaeota archaeon]
MGKKPKEEEQLAESISKKFLKEGKNFPSVNAILEAPTTVLKKVDDKIAHFLEEAGFITKVVELAALNPNEPFQSLLEGRGEIDDPVKFSMLKDRIIERLSEIVTEELMHDIIVAARLIERAEKKKEFYIKDKKEQKIMFLGLDNAGKSAIINTISGKIDLTSLKDLKPTKRVKREKLVTENFTIYVWDMGGQKEYRDHYLQKDNLELFFLQVDMLVYVIDMQDPDRFEESFAYLNKILETLSYLKEDPFILFFLHKADPDIIDFPEFQSNLELIKDKLLEIIQPYDFEYDAYPTSIYYLYSREKGFSSFIKGVLDDQKEVAAERKDPVKAMGQILDTSMNLTVNLANSVQRELQGINARLSQIFAWMSQVEKVLKKHYPGEITAQVGGPGAAAPPIPTTAQPSLLPAGINPPPTMDATATSEAQPMISSPEQKPRHIGVRTTMMDELKAIFAKKGIQK